MCFTWVHPLCCLRYDSVEKTITLPKNQAVALGANFGARPQAELWNYLSIVQEGEAVGPYAGTPTHVRQGTALAAEKARAVLRHFDSGNSYAPMHAERVHEPMSARVDALCCFEYALKSPTPSSTRRKWTPKSAPWMKSFVKNEWYKLFAKGCSETKESAKCKPDQEGEAGEESVCKEPVEGETNANHEALKEPEISKGPEGTHTGRFICHHVTDRLPVYSTLELPGSKVKFPKIYVPLLFAEYKKNSTSILQAFNQALLYCSYGVNFLFSLGITDEPVWGLIGAGTEGTIIMAWLSTRSLGETMNLKNGVCAEYMTFQNSGLHLLELYHCDRQLHPFIRSHAALASAAIHDEY